MDTIAWVLWLGGWLLSAVWSLVWLLIGGWVSTVAQVLAVLAGIAIWRYGWRRAPAEMMRQLGEFLRFVRGWLGRPAATGTSRPPGTGDDARRPVAIRFKEVGDVNMSTLMTLAMAIGLWLVWAAG